MAPNPWNGGSRVAPPTAPQNFSPTSFASLTTSGTSADVTFTTITNTQRPTFKITNKGSYGAYIAWGVGAATAVASSSTPADGGDYIAAGTIQVLDLQSEDGPTDTIAAIQDGNSTILEISYGSGQ